MSDYWFKPKSHGYGASPANWKGWAASLGLIVVDMVIVFALLVGPLLSGTQPGIGRIVLLAILMIATTAVFVWICKVKTDGEWRWRWGKR
jgi:hypothetical protein